MADPSNATGPQTQTTVSCDGWWKCAGSYGMYIPNPGNYNSPLPKGGLLLGTRLVRQVRDPVLAIELDVDLAAQ